VLSVDAFAPPTDPQKSRSGPVRVWGRTKEVSNGVPSVRNVVEEGPAEPPENSVSGSRFPGPWGFYRSEFAKYLVLFAAVEALDGTFTTLAQRTIAPRR
jgi:hypothetical protein